MKAFPSAPFEPGAKVAFTDTLGFTSEGVLRGYTSRQYAEVVHRDGHLSGCISIVPIEWLKPCPSPAPSGHSAPVGRRVRRSGAAG
ncbi:MAG: hypothetical protein QM651_16885 [Rhodoblastus sp.]